jgi:isopentenyl diphosphate isomerase/L-lactate dehydrogenase-like FMN-dependent dehydrogenase
MTDAGVDGLRYNELVERGLSRIRPIGMEPYLDLGSETRSGTRLNREYLGAITIEMRLLGSKPARTAARLFERDIVAPIVAAAICESRILKRLGPWDPPYLEQIARGLAEAGSMMSTGDVTHDELGRIVEQGAPVIHIVKPYADEERIYGHLEAARSLGCVAVGMDVDAMFLEKAWDEVPGPPYLGYQSSAQIAQYVRATPLPFVVKGILSVQDALAARSLGASAIVVSSHGGETIDYTVPILEMLPSIRKAVPDMTILVDSGFRRGSDVFKALALGADGVGLGTQLVVACAAAGRDGVRRMMQILQEELERVMCLTGSENISAIDPAVLHLPR